MRLDKFSHACFTVTVSGQSVAVDPGVFTADFVVPEHVVAIVITHQHSDHQDGELLRRIRDASPDATIYTAKDVQPLLADLGRVEVVGHGDSVSVGPFQLDFYGEFHAIIDRDLPRVDNVGVMINKKIYYPGDSFTAPDQPIDVLALPVAAPWMRISDTLEFLRKTLPRLAFPTHDAILSDAGKAIADRLAGSVAEKIGTEYKRLDNALEISQGCTVH